jgi:hypothetical protein
MPESRGDTALADVVVRFKDGTVLKGRSDNLSPTRDTFHLQVAGDPPGTDSVLINVWDLKAVFVVRDFFGDPERRERISFTDDSPVNGRKMWVIFKDHERLVGTSASYRPGCSGFFITPADPESNNMRCCVFPHATRSIGFL